MVGHKDELSTDWGESLRINHEKILLLKLNPGIIMIADKKWLFLTCSVLLLSSLKAQDRILIWEEDFGGTELDVSTWNFELGDGCPDLCGWGNNERQVYTKTNHKVKDGYLTIRADLNDSVYTSTRITTKDKYEFK